MKNLLSLFILLTLTAFTVRAQPSVTSVSPAQNATDAARNADIVLTFSEVIDGATVTANTFIIQGKQTGLIAGTFSGGGTNTITFNPTADFRAGETIIVTITTGVESDAGIAMSAPYSYSFSTAVASGPEEPPVFAPATVSISSDGAYSVYAADVDSDGDMDMLSASYSDNTIAWYENDGSQSFTPHDITTTAGGAASVYAADVDGDGDMDVLSASRDDDTIAWYENNGSQTFTPHDISTTADGVRSVYAADVDGDGDMDVLSASFTYDNISWFENDGSESFTSHVLPSPVDGPTSVYAADVDGDGDMDVLSASQYDNRIAWYENDGSETFTRRTITTDADYASSVYAIDVDGDGDMDVLSASDWDDTIAWYENDGSQTFTPHDISTTVGGAASVYATDVDGDGDMDVLSASRDDDTIAWYENNGSQSFSTHTITAAANGALSVYAVDMDGDGDMDVLSASDFDNKIAWYENTNLNSGRSVTFDGTDDLINIPDNAIYDDLGEMTLEVWINLNSSKRNGIIEKFATSPLEGSGFYLRVESTGEVRAAFLPSNNNSTIALTSETVALNEWTHIAATYDGDAVKVFINGIESASATGGSTLDISNNDNDIQIGALNWIDGYFDGKMDEIRIWNAARTADQIQQNMFQQLNGDEAGLIAYYSIFEGTGTTLSDFSTNANNGTFTGPAWSIETHPYGTFITGTEGWRMMSSPVGASYGDLLEPLWTQGFSGSDSPDFGSSNVYFWDEAAGAFSSISNATDIPAAGTGFITYVYDDVDFDETPDGFPKEIPVDYTQNSGLVSQSLSFTDNEDEVNDGWNLVGNPYGATIDWDAGAGWTTADLDASFYVWNDAAGAYQSWNGESGTLSDGLIAPWQGFWVKANAADPSLSLTDDVRSAGGVFLKEKPTPQLTFTLSGADRSSSAIVMLNENASADKDPLDAYKLQSLNENYLSLFSRLKDGTSLDINALPSDLEEPLQLGLDFDGSDLSGEFELSWNLEAFPDDWQFSLRDNVTEQEVDVREQSALRLQLSASAQKQKENNDKKLNAPKHGIVAPKVMKSAGEEIPRFTLTILPGNAVSSEPGDGLPTEIALNQNYPNPFNPSTVISYQLPVNSEVRLEVFDLIGRKVSTLVDGQMKAGRHQVTFDARNLASGMYIYRLKAGNTVFTKKLTLIK